MTISESYTNIDAEKSVLSCALQNADCAKTVAALASDEFTGPRHFVIHAAIRELSISGQPVDLVTMDAQLRIGDRLQTAGDTENLIDLMQYAPTIGNFKYYLGIMNTCTMRRRLRDIGTKLIEKSGLSDENADETREWCASALREIQTVQQGETISSAEAAMKVYSRLDAVQRHEIDPRRITSGIPAIDYKLGGFSGAKLVIVGARPSVGKSAFALTFCINAAKAGRRVLLISLEMDEMEITERVLAREGEATLSDIVTGDIAPDQWPDIAKSTSIAAGLPLWYCTTATTVEQIRRVAYSLYENGGLDLLVVDYLQLMEASNARRQNRQEQVAEISRGLRRLSSEMGIPVMALTQLNRQSEGAGYGGKKQRRIPTMSEARESGAIEQDANIFMLLHDPDIEEMRDDIERAEWKSLKDKGLTMIYVLVAKNRQGKKGMVTIAFDGAHMRFMSAGADT